MHVDDNPVATMPDEKRPDAICETCESELYNDSNKTAREQQSESGKYCEECIRKYCDTEANRKRWLVERGLERKYLSWLWESDTNETLAEFIRDEHEYDYFAWLMATN